MNIKRIITREIKIMANEWYLLKGDMIRFIRSKQKKPALDVWVRIEE